MTVDQIFEELRRMRGVILHPPAEERELAALEGRYGIWLPPFHRELLLKTNGIEACDGYFRLFGVGGNAEIDMGWWNETNLWKFAWEPQILEFFCFGEDAWGNQFAFRFDDVAVTIDPPAYFVPSQLTSVGSLGGSVGSFLDRTLIPNARDLRGLERSVRRRIGALESHEHFILSPDPLISGETKAKNAMKMPAVMAMIINGDVWREWVRISRGCTYFDFTVVAMEPYVDDQGRPRMRLVSDDDARAGGR